MKPRQCGACEAPVIQAFTDAGTAVLLDYPPDEHGAVAARIDPGSEVWRARFLEAGDTTIPDPAVEIRFRQHSVTCPGGPPPLVPDALPADDTQAIT